jgi:hypothetical protein
MHLRTLKDYILSMCRKQPGRASSAGRPDGSAEGSLPPPHHPHPLLPPTEYRAGVSLRSRLELFRGEQDALLPAGLAVGSFAECGAQQSAHAATGRQRTD